MYNRKDSPLIIYCSNVSLHYCFMLKFILFVHLLTPLVIATPIPRHSMDYARVNEGPMPELTLNRLGFEGEVSRFLHSAKYKVEESSDTLRDKLSDAKAKLVSADVLAKNEPFVEVQDCDLYDPYDTSNVKYYRGAPTKRLLLVSNEVVKSSYPRSKNYSQVVLGYELTNSTTTNSSTS